MTEETKKLCANCKYKMRDWKCMKHYSLDYVTGVKRFGICEEHRDGSYCKDYEDKEVGRSKTEDQLTIANEVSYLATTLLGASVVLGLFAFMIVVVIHG